MREVAWEKRVQESRNSICKVTEGAGRGPHTGHALEIETVCYS